VTHDRSESEQFPRDAGRDASEPADESGGSEHDPSGLDLARSVAGGYRKGRVRRRSRGKSKPRGVQASGAYPDERDPQTLDATIDRLVAEHGWQTDIAVHAVFARWDQIVGVEVAQHCKPERYADDELTVRADSTTWATQMRLLAADVVRRLNVELGDGTVTRIQVLGPQAPSWRKGRRTVRGRGPRDTYG
jgi:predicted nucleic acid-binding Zn ribbon protein